MAHGWDVFNSTIDQACNVALDKEKILDTAQKFADKNQYEKAIKELITYKGTQFDPDLVDVFLKLYNSFPDTIRNHIDELKE